METPTPEGEVTGQGAWMRSASVRIESASRHSEDTSLRTQFYRGEPPTCVRENLTSLGVPESSERRRLRPANGAKSASQRGSIRNDLPATRLD